MGTPYWRARWWAVQVGTFQDTPSWCSTLLASSKKGDIWICLWMPCFLKIPLSSLDRSGCSALTFPPLLRSHCIIITSLFLSNDKHTNRISWHRMAFVCQNKKQHHSLIFYIAFFLFIMLQGAFFLFQLLAGLSALHLWNNLISLGSIRLFIFGSILALTSQSIKHSNRCILYK